MRKLARVFFKDALRGLGRWRVKKNDCRHVFTKRLCDAGELLCQHPHTDAGVACRETEFGQLTGPSFHVFQEDLDLVLLANDRIQPRVSLAKPVQSLVESESWADQNNVIKLAFEWAAELVHEKLGLARVGRANYQRVEWNIAGVHFISAQNQTVCLQC